MLLGRVCKQTASSRHFRLPIEVNTVEYVQVPVGTSIADMERAMIMATLKRCGGNKTRTAAMLGVSLKTLYNRLNAYRALDMADLPGERIEGNDTATSAEKIA
jgi:DNA-binding NtrC family response regulator